jgi:hypothetical protein
MIYYRNALNFLKGERRKAKRIDEAYRKLNRFNLAGGFVDFLANPFIRSAISILEKFTGNYKVKEALRLLKEAGQESKK